MTSNDEMTKSITKGEQYLYFLKALEGLSMATKSEVILRVTQFPKKLGDSILYGFPDMPEPVRGETLRSVISIIARVKPLTFSELFAEDAPPFLMVPRSFDMDLSGNIHLGGGTRAIFTDRLSKPVENLSEDAGKQLASQLDALFPPGLTVEYEKSSSLMGRIYDRRTDFCSVWARPTSVSTPAGSSPLDMMETFLRSQDVLAPELADYKKSTHGHWKEHLFASPNDQPDDLD